MIVVQSRLIAASDGKSYHLYGMDGKPLNGEAYTTVTAADDSAYLWAFRDSEWYVLDLNGEVVY